MLPDADGFELCRTVRAESDVPVLMLTARGEDADRIVGLELGADDYLPKPFNPRELAARLKAVLRRTRPAQGRREVLRFGRLQIDRGARAARLDGARVVLTAHQFDLLCTLAERAGRVLSRAQLMQLVRGEELDAFESIDRCPHQPDPPGDRGRSAAAAADPHDAGGGVPLRVGPAVRAARVGVSGGEG